MILNVKRLNPKAILPSYAKPGDVGMDLHACLENPVQLPPGQRVLIDTGIAIAVPNGMEGQVRARSGNALRDGLSIVNGVGTIDQGYRFSVGVLLINLGQETVIIEHGQRIAQLVIAPVERVVLQEVKELDVTERGSGGWGSTGK